MGKVERYTTRADVCGMETRAGDSLVELHQLLSLFETVKEGSECTDIHGVGEDSHDVVKNAGDFGEESANPLCALWDINVEQLLDGFGVREFVGHGGGVVETVHVGERLDVVLVLHQLLSTAVEKTNVWIGSEDFFTVKLEDETEDTVGSWVLGTVWWMC